MYWHSNREISLGPAVPFGHLWVQSQFSHWCLEWYDVSKFIVYVRSGAMNSGSAACCCSLAWSCLHTFSLVWREQPSWCHLVHLESFENCRVYNREISHSLIIYQPERVKRVELWGMHWLWLLISLFFCPSWDKQCTDSHPLSLEDNDKSRLHQHLWGMYADPLQVSRVHTNSALMNWGPFPRGLYTCVIRKPGSLTFLSVSCLFLFPCTILLITNNLLFPLELCSLKAFSQWAESDDSQIVLTQSSSHRRTMLPLWNTALLWSDCASWFGRQISGFETFDFTAMRTQ